MSFAPFISTSNYNLKDRLPTTYHEAAVYSNQDWKISDSWTELWDGNIDKTFFNAEVTGDNDTASDSSHNGWWSEKNSVRKKLEKNINSLNDNCVLELISSFI